MIRNVPARQWFASRIPLLLCVVLLGPGVVPLSGHAWHPSPTPHERPHHQTHTGLGTAPENEEPIGIYQALWLSLRSSALCGLVPISILYLVPRQPSEQALTWIQAGAVGGLLGDVFFHLFPHIAAQSADTTGSLVWYVVLLGILIFFFMDSVIHCAVSRDAHGEASVRRKHGPTSEGLSNQRNHTSSFPDKENTRRSIQASSCSRLWLTLCGDGLHNFADGVALFTAFRLSYASGVATSLSIFAHEIPHEMGDFALLFSQGLSRYQVIKTQIGTSLCSLMGCLVTAFVSNLSHTIEAWAPPFVAGTMLYLSLGSFLPQLLKRRGNIWDVMGSFVSCLLGVSIVALLAHMEETEFFVSL